MLLVMVINIDNLLTVMCFHFRKWHSRNSELSFSRRLQKTFLSMTGPPGSWRPCRRMWLRRSFRRCGTSAKVKIFLQSETERSCRQLAFTRKLSYNFSGFRKAECRYQGHQDNRCHRHDIHDIFGFNATWMKSCCGYISLLHNIEI